MSNDYKLWCLSHDPAVEIDDGGEWASAESALDALSRRTDHAKCDVVIGRYSYPLIEVGCVRSSGCYHTKPQWMDAYVLRLLLALQGEDVCLPQHAAAALYVVGDKTCWAPYRVARLREVLS